MEKGDGVAPSESWVYWAKTQRNENATVRVRETLAGEPQSPSGMNGTSLVSCVCVRVVSVVVVVVCGCLCVGVGSREKRVDVCVYG